MSEMQKVASAPINLQDVVDFFRRNKKIVTFFCVAGLMCAVTYLVITPKKYEARWQLQMALFGNSNSNSNSSNSEEPEALVQRLRSPTTYSAAVRQVCGLVDEHIMHDFLDDDFDVRVVKNVSTSVDMKLRAASISLANQCAEAMVGMITAQQATIIGERMAGRNEQLQQYQRALQDEQQQLAMIANSELGRFGYLAKLDKISWLRTRIDGLQEEALLSLKHPAKLTAPIFVSSKAVSPKVPLILLMGMLMGLVLGVLYALNREGMRRAT